MTADFDLRSLIHAELESSPVADPHVVAEHVVKRINDHDLRAALAACLPDYVRNIAHQPGTSPTPGDAAASTSSPSRKWAASNEWATYLRERICVDAAGRTWKFLGECTGDDLLSVARFRRTQAGALLLRAERFEALAEKMRCHRAATVADLDLRYFGEAMG